jgi:hypothetical protein
MVSINLMNIFKNKSLYYFIITIFILPSFLSAQTFIIKGRVLEQDSLNAIPFVYIVNKNTNKGELANNEGYFSIAANENDTLIISEISHHLRKIAVKYLDEKIKNGYKNLNVYLVKKYFRLDEAIIIGTKISESERQYMNRKLSEINLYKKAGSFNGLSLDGPITAMWYKFSKRGKELQKLEKLYSGLFYQEQAEKKLNPAILQRLTEDPNINYPRFRKFAWYVSDEYIATHDGYELYSTILSAYKAYKRAGN